MPWRNGSSPESRWQRSPGGSLDGPELGAAVLAHHSNQADAEPITTAIGADKTRLAEIAEMFADGDMTREQVTAATQRVNSRMQANLDRLAADTTHRDLTHHLGRGDQLRGQWQAMTLDQRRAVIRAVVAKVTIGSAAPGIRAFQPERVSVTWRV